jgi:hypothetical protein
MDYRSQPQQTSTNGLNNGFKYTLYSWVIFLLPFLAGLTLTTVFYFSISWAVVLIGLAMFVLINNILVVLYKLYDRPASRIAIVGQIYISCFFGLMLLGKAYSEWWLYFVLVLVFLINSLLGLLYRKQIYSGGILSRSILTLTIGFPVGFALWIYYGTDWPYTIVAPGMIGSIAAGFCYVNGVVVETMLRNE